MLQENIKMLEETLKICKQGYYNVDGQKKELAYSPEEMRQARVFLPEDLEEIKSCTDFPHVIYTGRCSYECRNMDSFSMARKTCDDYDYEMFHEPGENVHVLVLNFANAIKPGGGVRNGRTAQEEDLCRKSSLLLSLESESAKTYYAFNQKLDTQMGSDAIVISPYVEIIRDEKGNLLKDPVTVSVMTCAAPNISGGLHGLTQDEYEKMLYNRIQSMLRCAAYCGFQYLVLGAFGCGVFQNDPRLVSDLFYRALKEFDFDGMTEKDTFRDIAFAVLAKDENEPNFREFYRNFGENHFYREEDAAQEEAAKEEMRKAEKALDRIEGSLIGGAVGDALGYPVEFQSREEICRRFGPNGITEYELDRATGKALISDDTQMTLFTANGILVGETRLCMRGIGGQPSEYVPMSYQDWLTTQTVSYEKGRNTKRYNGNGGISWLLDVPELYASRAPGGTCLNSLEKQRAKKHESCDYLKKPVNDRKGCGGIMRIAPLGLFYKDRNPDALDLEGARLAAITHGHSLGYMPCAVLTHILNRIVYPWTDDMSLTEIIRDAQESTNLLFSGDAHLPELNAVIDLAVELSQNQQSDEQNIPRIGEGWVAEETLGIALYCALRYEHDFSAGVTAAVNITGDSDSTGAVTGNILGAINGYHAIDSKWTEHLELLPVLKEMAADLCHGCQMSEFSSYEDPDWERKYIDMHWKSQKQYTWFWHEYEENGYLSNAYPCRFVIDDFCYRHAEQYLMAQKAKLFHDSEMYTEILRANTPGECKKLGRKVSGFRNEIWENARMDILRTALRAKFSQNQDLRKKLLDTGNTILVKSSPYDAIYGIKMTADQAENLDESQWQGKNLLGCALMEIRAELGADQE